MAGEEMETGGVQRRAGRSDSGIPVSMMPTQPLSVLKERKKQSALGGSSSWEWKAFTNSSRTDGLELRHWQRKGQPISDYPFAGFQKKVCILPATRMHCQARCHALLCDPILAFPQRCLLHDPLPAVCHQSLTGRASETRWWLINWRRYPS